MLKYAMFGILKDVVMRAGARTRKKRIVEDMWLIVGLGNPGDKYKNNRHNVGFMVVDQIADDNMFSNFKSKFSGEVSEGRLGSINGGQKVALLKPMTFMNDSGISVRKAADFYKIPPEKIIVFHDELDIEPSRVKVKQGGGTGGHNGLKSMDQHLGDKDYWRVRLGIGHPGDKNRVSGYVLNDFSKDEQTWLEDWIYALSKNIDDLLQDNKDDYTTRVSEGFRI